MGLSKYYLFDQKTMMVLSILTKNTPEELFQSHASKNVIEIKELVKLIQMYNRKDVKNIDSFVKNNNSNSAIR